MKLTISDIKVHLFFPKYLEISFLLLILVTFTSIFKVIFVKFNTLFNFVLFTIWKTGIACDLSLFRVFQCLLKHRFYLSN